MTYKEIFEQLRKQMGPDADYHSLDQLLESVNRLPCTGRGPSKPLFREEHVAVDVRGLDSGVELPAEYGCVHCTWLAGLKWIKSAIEAERNGTSLPPMP